MDDEGVMRDTPILSAWLSKLNEDPSAPPVVVFAEGDDPRVRAAANVLVHHQVSPLLICGNSFGSCAADEGGRLSKAVTTVAASDLASGHAGRRIHEIGVRRGWQGPSILARRNSPLYLAAAAVDVAQADACVAGSLHASADVLRAGIHVLGLNPDSRFMSSSFLLVLPDGRALSFADCAVLPDPDEDELAEVAVSTARTFETLTGETPLVAMLSFSTFGSADHVTVRRVRAATGLVRQRAPHLAVDGEMQFDAALITSVARRKAAGSSVAGRANVFIFPNLAAGNIGYKIAERLGGAQTFGPILQGLAAPMNDLSRGCSVGDIVSVALIGALQARERMDVGPTSAELRSTVLARPNPDAGEACHQHQLATDVGETRSTAT